LTTKLHARCDAKGRPLGFVLTPGQTHDVNGFAPQFRMISDKIEAFLGDKGYDSDAIREELAKAEVEAVIPAKSNCKSPAPHDREKYRWRSASSINSRTVAGSKSATTKPKNPISASSPSHQLNCGYPLSTKP
jgi:IS5 family transposase